MSKRTSQAHSPAAPTTPLPPDDKTLCRRLRRLLNSLERKDHHYTWDQWAELERFLDPAQYLDRPLPAQPTKILRQEERAVIFAERRKKRRHIWHPGDALNRAKMSDQEQALAAAFASLTVQLVGGGGGVGNRQGDVRLETDRPHLRQPTLIEVVRADLKRWREAKEVGHV